MSQSCERDKGLDKSAFPWIQLTWITSALSIRPVECCSAKRGQAYRRQILNGHYIVAKGAQTRWEKPLVNLMLLSRCHNVQGPAVGSKPSCWWKETQPFSSMSGNIHVNGTDEDWKQRNRSICGCVTKELYNQLSWISKPNLSLFPPYNFTTKPMHVTGRL